MANIDRAATAASSAIRRTLERLRSLAAITALITLVVGAATFATGWWVFHGTTSWLVIGGVLCAAPVVAAAIAWVFVRATVRLSDQLLPDVRTLMGQSREASSMFIDYDSGQALGIQARSFRQLRSEVTTRKAQLPALYVCTRAITSVPGLAAMAIIGTVLMGGFGTILLLVGLFR